MTIHFKELDRNDRHCHVSVFSGMTRGGELGLSGTLVLDTELWDALKGSLERKPTRIQTGRTPSPMDFIELALSP